MGVTELGIYGSGWQVYREKSASSCGWEREDTCVRDSETHKNLET